MYNLNKGATGVSEKVEIFTNNVSANSGENFHFDIDTWNGCLTSQFPVNEVEETNHGVILKIGAPHQSYTIKTTMKNGQLDGKAVIFTPNNMQIAEFTYVNGDATGKCKLCYESGMTYFIGNLENGYRKGIGKEYDRYGNIIYNGMFDMGNRCDRYEPSEETKNYWVEKDSRGFMKSYCRKDKNGNNNGVCYFFDLGQIQKVSYWENNEEVELLYEFNDNIMTEYKNGYKFFEGTYYGDYLTKFYRISGREFNKKGDIVYIGDYFNNKRSGLGTQYFDDVSTYEGEWILGLHKAVYIITINVMPWLIFLLLIIIVFFFHVGWLFKLLWVCVIVCLMILYFLFTKKKWIDQPITREFVPAAQTKPRYDNDFSVVFPENRFNYVSVFKIYGLETVKHLVFECNSFNTERNKVGDDSSKTFLISTCSSLESIEMAPFCFADYAGSFNLLNLSSLESIRIGSLDTESDNFLYVSFTINSLNFTHIMIVRPSEIKENRIRNIFFLSIRKNGH